MRKKNRSIKNQALSSLMLLSFISGSAQAEVSEIMGISPANLPEKIEVEQVENSDVKYGAVCLKRGFVFSERTIKCTDEVSLQSLRDKISSTNYESTIDERIDNAMNAFRTQAAFSFGTYVSGIGQDLFTRLDAYGKAPTSNYLMHSKAWEGPRIIKQLAGSEVLDVLLHSATNDIIKDYRTVLKYKESKEKEYEDNKGDAVVRDKIVAELVQVEVVLEEIIALLEQQLSKLAPELKPDQVSRLANSAPGHREIQLMVVTKNMESFVHRLQERALEKNQDESIPDSVKVSEVRDFMGAYAFYIKLVLIAMDNYADQIDKVFIPKINQLKKSAQSILDNNAEHIDPETKSINDKVVEISEKYAEALSQRSKYIRSNEKRTSMDALFTDLAVKYSTNKNAGELAETISFAEDINNSIEGLLNSGILEIEKNGVLGDITIDALNRIESSIFSSED